VCKSLLDSIETVYMVPFLRYSASNNVTLKSGVGVVEGRSKWRRSIVSRMIRLTIGMV